MSSSDETKVLSSSLSSSSSSLSLEETDQENYDIAQVILHKVVKNTSLLLLPYEKTRASSLSLYVIFPGATSSVASQYYKDCEWYDVVYGRTPGSIRVFSSQDYSILFRYYQTMFVKNQVYHRNPSDKLYKMCIRMITFAHKHLRPTMIKRGLVGSRRDCCACMENIPGYMQGMFVLDDTLDSKLLDSSQLSIIDSSLEYLNQIYQIKIREEEVEYKEWFGLHNQQVFLLPYGHKTMFHLSIDADNTSPPPVLDTMSRILAVIMSSWAVLLDLAFHVEFPTSSS